MLIIITIVFLKLAYAKYTKYIEGNAEAQIANLVFLVNESSEEFEEIKVADTRTDENIKVDRNCIAPDTKGYIPIVIDASRNSNFYNL